MILRPEAFGALLGIATWVGCGSDPAARSGDSPGPSSSGGVEPSPPPAAEKPEAPAPLQPVDGPVGNPEVMVAPVLAPTPPASGPTAPAGEGTTVPSKTGTPVERHGHLHVDGPQLVDESGQPVQLKGVSTMWLNWEDRYSNSAEGLKWMRDNWGLSVIRAAMGVEPRGAYLTNPDQALADLRTVVQNAIDAGVYVLVDWHDHHAELHRDQAISFFSRVASEYGQLPNVLYETFNEPLELDWSTGIKPYHEAVLQAIRAQDPDNVAVLGTRSWSQRVDQAALDPVAGINLMYTVHFYACDHRDSQRRQAQAAYDAGLPLFVTEWGATPADGGARNPIVCEADAQVWHDWMDERGISWAAWKLDGCRDSSCFFTSRTAPVTGGWTNELLNGHARFVVERLLD
jgi:endoglucanase